MKVAVLGLGRMGQAIARRLADGGHELTVWNRSPGKAAGLVEAGATEAEAPEQAAGPAEVVVSCLSDDSAVRDLMLDRSEVRAAVGSRIYVDASTVSPPMSAELGRAYERFVALPVLGAPEAVRDRAASYLAGGPADLIDRLEPLLSSLGGNVRRYPRPETATSAKLAVNLLLLSAVVSLAEALAVGRAGGLTDQQLADLFGDSPMLGPGVKNRLQAVVTGEGPTWWTTVLAAKDAGLALDLAHAAGRELRLAPVVRDAYRAAADAGLDGEDMAAVGQLYR